MANFAFYMATVLIWGSTWIAIEFQLGVVEPVVSITYRFALAAATLFAFCWITRKPLRFSLRNHAWMALLGLCLFSGNYMFIYFSTGYITSGLVSVVFCLMLVLNILMARVFFGKPFEAKVMAGAALGMAGIALVFSPEIQVFSFQDATFLGVMLALCGTCLASSGNMVSTRNQNAGIPVVQANTWGMFYGALFMGLLALIQGKDFNYDPSFAYSSSLIFLAIFGSVIAFGSYLSLLGRIGPDRAAYAVVMFPIVALTLSTLFEGYIWTPAALIGVALVLAGNIFTLAKPRRKPKQADLTPAE